MIRVKKYHGCCDAEKHNPNFCVPPLPVDLDEKGFGVYLFNKMKMHLDDVLQINGDTDEKLTYAYVLERSIHIAEALKARGVTSNDIVAFCTANNEDNYITLLACLFIGAKITAIDPTFSKRSAVYFSDMIKPKIMFCDTEGEALIESIRSEITTNMEIIVFGNNSANTSLSELCEYPVDTENFEPTPVDSLEDVFSIFFTSGTSGVPHGVCLSHDTLMRALLTHKLPPMSMLTLSKMYWITGSCNVYWAIITGGKYVFFNNFDIDNVLRIIQEYKITFTYSSPYFARQVSEANNVDKYDLSSLMLVMVIGAALGESDMIAFRKKLPNTITFQAMGQTETCGGTISMNPMTDLKFIRDKPTSCGRIMPGTCGKVVDVDTGKLCGPHEQGEFRVKTDRMMNGYFGQPEESEALFDEEGYLCTGDIMTYDEDYCFYFVSRMSDKMKYRNAFIYPVHIEEELIQHEDVVDAAAFGIEDAINGDLPAAVVVLKENAKVTPEQLLLHIKNRMTDYNHLRGGLAIVESISRTVSGKIQRKVYQTMVAEGKITLIKDAHDS